MPAVLWSLVALLLADIGWARGTIRHRTALLFGLVCGFGMLIRGSFFGALFLPLVYLLVLRREPLDVRAMATRYLAYAAGFVLPFAGWAVRNSLIVTGPPGPDANNQLAMIFRESPVDPTSPFRSGVKSARWWIWPAKTPGNLTPSVSACWSLRAKPFRRRSRS